MDRNNSFSLNINGPLKSLSARRAWIEIISEVVTEPLILLSLSARRAWIEMIFEEQTEQDSTVALRKESVDRNLL